MKISDMLTNYETQIVEFEEVNTMTFLHSGHPRTLNHSIEKFRNWRKENNLPPSMSRTFNIPFEFNPATGMNHFQLLLAAQINQNQYSYTNGFEEKLFPSMRCAKIRHEGSDDQLDHISRYLKGSWAFSNNETKAEFPLFFERIIFSNELDEDQWVTDVYLPLKN